MSHTALSDEPDWKNRYAARKARHLEQLLHAVNGAAIALLTPAHDEGFAVSLLKAMDLMGRCLDVDRVQIWRNEVVDWTLHFVLRYEWLSDIGRQKTSMPAGLKFPYRDKPEWESKFLRGEYINGPLSAQPLDDQDFLRS